MEQISTLNAEESSLNAGAGGSRPDAITALRSMIKRKNAYWQRLVVLKAVAFSIAAPLAYLWLVFYLDSVIHFPVLGRCLASLVLFAMVIRVGRRFMVEWGKSRFSEDQVAIAIEKHTPAKLENRLINSIQLSREKLSPDVAVTQAVVEENYRHLRDIQLQRPVAARSAVVQAALAVALIMAGLLFWTFQQERFAKAATRIFLPFSRVTPVYRTVLAVEPGDVKVKAGDDVTIQVSIKGKIPTVIAVLQNVDGKRTSIEVPLGSGTNRTCYTFKTVTRAITYAVRGGDYVTPFYTISIPVATELKSLTAVYRYPPYTRLAERRQESSGGDLEALYGTQAELRFGLTHLAGQVSMLVETAGGVISSNGPPGDAWSSGIATNAALHAYTSLRPIPLKKIAPTEFSGEIVLKDVVGYKLEIRRENDPVYESKRYEIYVTADRVPELQLSGLDQQTEVMVDAVVPLVLAAKDDFGLKEAGIFYRTARSQQSETGGQNTNTGWLAIKTWTVPDQAPSFESKYALPVAVFNAVEGDELEIAARGRDTDPLKGDYWSTGQRHQLMIGGSGVAFQALYERILRTEAELKGLVKGLDSLTENGAIWLRKLDAASGLRWDDQKNLQDLAEAMRALAKSQSQIRARASDIARNMVAQSGNLRLSVGMLADSEMVRSIQIIEKVSAGATPQAKRSTLADARLVQERTSRSLNEIIGQYLEFRKDWELDNMIPFTRMLAERQLRMKGESLTYAELSELELAKQLQDAARRRQLKFVDLAGLVQTAFVGMGQRVEVVGLALATAFTNAAAAFDSSGLKPEMRQAADKLGAGRWREAALNQEKAAGSLAEIHAGLRKAQLELAQKALAELKGLAVTNLNAQPEIAELKSGTTNFLFDLDLKDYNLTDVLHMQAAADKLKKKFAASGTLPQRYDQEMENLIMELSKIPIEGHQGIDGVTLAKKPSGAASFPDFANLDGERIKSRVQEEFADIVGNLLDEIEELQDQYDSYNLTSSIETSDSGDISPPDGMFSSSQARGFTGNQKPLTKNFGGASRTGRQGGRTYGMAVGDKSINRRGRDNVQEGDQEAPDQEGLMQEVMSDDPQKETSTGIGGKEVGADRTSFSTRDEGEWKDEMADRLKSPQATARVVERQDKPLNPRVAEMLRDLESSQEQVIEIIKRIKKELDNLYLPTDHLDEIMDQLAAGANRLQETPDAEAFRQQMENLDKLKGLVVVFNRPSSEFQPSVVREQVVRGRILDEPAWPTIPGYEDVVKRYYKMLAGQ